MTMQPKMTGRALRYRPLIEAELSEPERTRAYAGQARVERQARIAAQELRAATSSYGQESRRAPNWFCLQVTRGQEFSVENVLKSAGVEVLLPSEKAVRVRRGKKIESEHPILSGYLLLRFVPSAAAFHGVRRQKHVVDIVGGPYGYHVVADQDVRAMQMLMASETSTRVATDKTLKQGDTAEITVGPFAGFLCILSAVRWCRQARAAVVIDLLGKQFRIDSMPLAFLKKL